MVNYKERTCAIIRSYKCTDTEDEFRRIPIYGFTRDDLNGFLEPITHFYKSVKPNYVSTICEWRQNNPEGFANRFTGTNEKTAIWLNDVLLPREDRILFMVYPVKGRPIGHLGYSNFNFMDRSCEIDNVVRGDKERARGLMSLAMKTILDWGMRVLELESVYLRVLADNPHAIQFYKRLGFEKQWDIPLYRVETGDMVSWEAEKTIAEAVPEKYYTLMKLR